MKFLIIISVRMESTRLPNKAMLPLNGSTMIELLIDHMRLSKNYDEMVLYTTDRESDDILEDIAIEKDCMCYRGDRDDHVGSKLAMADMYQAEAIARVTGDNPLTSPFIADIIMNRYILGNVDYVRVDGLPIGITSEVISTEALRKVYDSVKDKVDLGNNLTYHIYDNVDSICRLTAPKEINRPNLRLTVDYMEDYNRVKKIVDKVSLPGYYSIFDIVRWSDRNG